MYPTTLTYIIDADTKKVLLGRHLRGIGEGKINAPGGKVHTGETSRQSACREVLEETGIVVQPSDLKKVGYLVFRFEDGSHDHDCVVYRTESWSGEPVSSDELSLDWYSVDALPYDEMWEGDEIWLSDILSTASPLSWSLDYDGDRLISSQREDLRTRLILTRHGWSHSNELGIYDSKDEYDLTSKGHIQAIQLSESLKAENIDVIFGSPFARCVQTIAPTSEYHKLPYYRDDRLREISFGSDSGHPYIAEYKYKRLEDHDFSHDGGECFSQVLDRCQDFVDEIRSSYAGQTILICTHGNPGRALHYILSGRDSSYLAPSFEFTQAVPEIFELSD